MSETKAIYNVECPCCHGKGYQRMRVESLSGDGSLYLQQVYCCHCEGKGTIKAEVEDVIGG